MATACPQNRHRQMMKSNAQRSSTVMESASVLRRNCLGTAFSAQSQVM